MHEASSRTFAWWLAAPIAAAALVAVPLGLITGYGVVLGPILALCAAVVWLGARGLWRRAGVGNVLAGLGLGFLSGTVAGALTYGAFALDARIGPSLGGSVVKTFVEGAIDDGFQKGVQAAQPGGAANVAMAPAVLVSAPVGAAAGALGAILIVLLVSGLPGLTGVIGGAIAANKLRG
jgi:hypothetical protein